MIRDIPPVGIIVTGFLLIFLIGWIWLRVFL
jgi:hypothetical protein